MKNRAICRRCSVVLALVMVIWLSPAALAAVPDRPDNKYVLDTARVLSEGTERRIIAENQELFEECGGEIVVVAVDFLGGQDIEDYTYKMFNSWGVGSQERNNGILLVLAIGEENYYIQAGYGIEDYFDALFLSDILEEQLEPDFAAGDYDAGVKKTFDALISELRSYYDSGPGREEAPAPGQEYDYSDEDWDEDWGFSGLRELKTIAFALVRVVVIRHYGFKREETAAFGDGMNDLGMIRWAGTGVAMGNAEPEVKAVADYVTTPVWEDGVKNALLHLGILTDGDFQ